MALNLDSLGLSAKVTAEGISAPDYQTILSTLISYFQQIYGSDAYLEPDSKDGQMVALMALAIHDANNMAITVYNCFSPATGYGAALTSNVKINGISRTLLSGQSHTIMDHAHNMELWTGDGLAAGSAREGANPGILATYGDGGIVKTDEPGLRVPSSLRALSSRSVKRYGEISENVGTETRPRNIAFNFLVRAK